ncbi:general odorant-binding protein 83a-like [Microplitis mediator]|uniref:general odorant-binding protein 83a-like n=1 Tax=Microplitis mediator TaxID=375433 RepID=UPI0025572771|nr:general odorant-binding protein 83a-like [Microplitis mediator]
MMCNIYTIAFATFFIMSINFFHTEGLLKIEQVENMMKPMGKSCAAKTGLTPELQEAHKNRDFVDDEKLKCYIYCICKMTKMLDKDNNVNLDSVRKQLRAVLPEDLAEKSIKAHEECTAKVTTKESCELAYQYAICFHGIVPDLYFFP